jgi:hypothetical protein
MKWILDKNQIFQCETDIEKISYPEDGNDLSYDLEENGVWFKQRNDLIISLIKKHPFSGDFLDIGGGNGFQAKELKKSGIKENIILCEPGYSGCLFAKKREVEYVYNGIFQNFPFKDYKIGAVGLFDVVEHIENDSSFLNELYHLLPDGAKVYITVPAMKLLWAEIDPLSGHYRRYNKKEVNRLVSQIPFKLVDSGYYFSFYVLPMFLLRVIPFRLGVRKGWDKIVSGEKNNHKENKGFISKLIDYAHARSIRRLLNGGKQLLGTSMYIVLEKK